MKDKSRDADDHYIRTPLSRTFKGSEKLLELAGVRDSTGKNSFPTRVTFPNNLPIIIQGYSFPMLESYIFSLRGESEFWCKIRRRDVVFSSIIAWFSGYAVYCNLVRAGQTPCYLSSQCHCKITTSTIHYSDTKKTVNT